MHKQTRKLRVRYGFEGAQVATDHHSGVNDTHRGVQPRRARAQAVQCGPHRGQTLPGNAGRLVLRFARDRQGQRQPFAAASQQEIKQCSSTGAAQAAYHVLVRARQLFRQDGVGVRKMEGLGNGVHGGAVANPSP